MDRGLHHDLRPLGDQPPQVGAGGLPLLDLGGRRGRAPGGGRARGARALRAEEDRRLAERAASAAGGLLLERFRAPARGVERKSSRTDLVSDADRDAESALERILLSERPEDGLLGEEGSGRAGTSGRRWVVDPLDGTTNFLYGLPAWCVSVAVEDERGALAGAVLDPLADELFSAARGAGATLDGTPIEASTADALETALVATGFGYDAGRRGAQAEVLTRVLPRVRDIRRAGAAALDLCWVACGRVDAYYERGLQPWDWAAGALIAREAGAAVRPLGGEPRGLAAGPEAILDELVSLVA